MVRKNRLPKVLRRSKVERDLSAPTFIQREPSTFDQRKSLDLLARFAGREVMALGWKEQLAAALGIFEAAGKLLLQLGKGAVHLEGIVDVDERFAAAGIQPE